MAFEDNITTRMTLTKGHTDPPPTDLDYYAKPENYTGGALSLQTFMLARQKFKGPLLEKEHKNKQPDVLTLEDNDAENPEAEPNASGQSRRGSIHIPLRRGSIQLDIKRKLSNGSVSSRPNSGKQLYRRLSSTDAPIEDDGTEAEKGKTDVDIEEIKRRIQETNARLARRLSGSVDEDKERTTKARNRFRHAINIVLILRKWISTLTEREQREDTKAVGGRTFTDIATEAFTSGDSGENAFLTFDLSLYKANREINISNEVKSILSIPSSLRSPEQIQTALYGLQHLKSFAEYPLHMQEKLCKVAWYQQVPPKRVIIRQGHYAENFYFILAGQALVRILEKNPTTGEPNLRTATIMRKGTSFGELALLHHSRRTATVVSQDTVQLLSIGRDDFFDIFMGGGAPGEIPEHIKFCSNLDFMKDYPIERILEHPECCLFHFFKRGVVIVKDCNQSDWLYIVKSGSCQVMKELKGVVPSKPKRPNSAKHLQSMQGNTFDLNLNNAAKVDTGLRRPHTRARLARTPTPVLSAREEYTSLTRNGHKPSGRQRTPVPHCQSENDPSNKPGYSVSRFRALYPSARKAHFTPSQIDSSLPSPTSQDARTTTPSPTVDSRPSPSPRPSDKNKQDGKFVQEVSLRGPVFVQVEVLKPKDVFGLTTVKFDDDFSDQRTSVSLVSNGAECIMLSKKFFMDHANEVVRKMIRHQVRHYPSEGALQQNLQSKVDWDLYKKRLVRDTMEINSFKGLFVK